MTNEQYCKVREIEVETFLQAMGTGISRPVLIIGDDYEEYILKNQSVDEDGRIVNYDCMFINELLAYQIGDYLGVPMPEAVVAIVGQELISGDPKIMFAYRFQKGKYFATQKLPLVESNLEKNYRQLASMGRPYRKKTWAQFFDNITNKEDIVKIIAFDILIANFDRYNNEGNILVDRSNQRKLYAIDHGHAFFGPMWNQDKAQCLNLVNATRNYIDEYTYAIKEKLPGNMFNALEIYIDLTDVDNNPFYEIAEKIVAIDENMIELWMNNIPNEWYINKPVQIAYYKNFILKNKGIVPIIIQNLAQINAFTNYRGGSLRWSSQNQKFHIV